METTFLTDLKEHIYALNNSMVNNKLTCCFQADLVHQAITKSLANLTELPLFSCSQFTVAVAVATTQLFAGYATNDLT